MIQKKKLQHFPVFVHSQFIFLFVNQWNYIRNNTTHPYIYMRSKVCNVFGILYMCTFFTGINAACVWRCRRDFCHFLLCFFLGSVSRLFYQSHFTQRWNFFDSWTCSVLFIWVKASTTSEYLSLCEWICEYVFMFVKRNFISQTIITTNTQMKQMCSI